MRPVTDRWGIYINGILAVRLHRSDMLSGSNRSGFAMWSYDCRSLGKVRDGSFLIEAVAAANLLNGDLAPQWRATSAGGRLLHPRYTLEVEGSGIVWVPKIVDELFGRSHYLRPMKTYVGAVSLLEDLLRRLVGREMPELHRSREFVFDDHVRRALEVVALDLPALVRGGYFDPDRWNREPRVSLLKPTARWFDSNFGRWLDPVPLLGTMMACYIKWALLAIYRGAVTISFRQDLPPVTFTTGELLAFRRRFRQHPMTDEEYMGFVKEHFIMPLRKLRRRDRGLRPPKPASRQRYQPKLHPRRDCGDYPLCWPVPPGTRLFKVYQDRQVRRRLPRRA